MHTLITLANGHAFIGEHWRILLYLAAGTAGVLGGALYAHRTAARRATKRP